MVAIQPSVAWLTTFLLTVGVTALLSFPTACRGSQRAEQGPSPGKGDPAITGVLSNLLQKYDVPGAAAAIVTSEGIQQFGAAGVRKYGADVPVTLQDKWHLGSDTKAMTAALVGLLVERGLLRWDRSVDEVFPEFAAEFHPMAKKITVLQLLTHTAGLSPNVAWNTYNSGPVQKDRLRLVRRVLAAKPQTPPGTVAAYSNVGYVIVGAIIEKVSKRSWEETVKSEVFRPLQMRSAGFGGPGTSGTLDQPWGHTKPGHPTTTTGQDVDNPPVLGPAGRVHCTVQDWSRFIVDQLRGAQGRPGLLRAESYAKLHQKGLGGFSPGWLVLEREWGDGTVLHHAGCNTMYYAVAWLAPKRGFAVLVCVNQGDDTAAKLSDEAAGALIELFLSSKNGGK